MLPTPRPLLETPQAPCTAMLTRTSRIRRDDLLQTPGPWTGDARDAPLGTNTFLRRPVSGAGAPSETDAAHSPRGLVPEPPSASTLQVMLLQHAATHIASQVLARHGHL